MVPRIEDQVVRITSEVNIRLKANPRVVVRSEQQYFATDKFGSDRQEVRAVECVLLGAERRCGIANREAAQWPIEISDLPIQNLRNQSTRVRGIGLFFLDRGQRLGTEQRRCNVRRDFEVANKVAALLPIGQTIEPVARQIVNRGIHFREDGDAVQADWQRTAGQGPT